MPRSSNQKRKILYVADFLTRKSDEFHPVTMAEIIDELKKYDIVAERKSIYDDLNDLKEYGLDIIYSKQNGGGYYIATRDFELAELKMLVDVVSSSQFITERKSRALIGKITKLANEYDAKQLKRELEITGRVKSMNESIFYNVDAIYEAMSENVSISFKHIHWKNRNQTFYKNDGNNYVVSPWRLYYEDEHYYLIGFDNNDRKIKYFRVDKMFKIIKTKKKREGKSEYNTHMDSNFSHRNFHMYSGRRANLTLKATEDIMGVIVDKFGEEVMMRKDGDSYIIHTEIDISSQFYGWLVGLAGKVKIIEPYEEVLEFKNYINSFI